MMEQINMFEMMYKTFKFDCDKEITVLETFAGIGSQRKALDRLSAKHNLKMKYMAPVEFDKYPVNSYNAIFGTEHNMKDITQTHSKDYHEQIDIFTYSFPCQDISLAGNRKGLSKENNTRSGLLWEVERLLKEFKNDDNLPKVLLMENVKNLLGEQNRADFNLWIRELEKLGYSNYFQVLNAKDYGIPQNRERVFMVSILGEYNYNFPQPIPLKLRLKDLLEDEVDEKYYLSDKMMKYITSEDSKYQVCQSLLKVNKQITSPITTREGNTRADASSYICSDLPDDYNLKESNSNVIANLNYWNHDQSNRVYDIEKEAPTLRARMGDYTITPKILIPEATKKGYAEASVGDGVDFSYLKSDTRRGRVQKGMMQTLKTSGVDVGVVVGGLYHNTSPEFTRKPLEEMARTIKCDDSSGIINYNTLRIRKLTPLECIRLMGFDDEDYYKMKSVNMSNTQIYKQCGNSIVVNVLEAIFEQLI